MAALALPNFSSSFFNLLYLSVLLIPGVALFPLASLSLATVFCDSS